VTAEGEAPADPAAPTEPVELPQTQPEVDAMAVLPAAAMDEKPATRRTLRARFDLHLPGPLVALLTGAIVGLALVGLTSGGLTLCSSMRGTSSCGKPGILLLLVITVAMVFLGSLLLRVAGVDPHGSTSFLGVGLLVVVILIALLPVIFHWWMVIVVPVVAMLTYAASWWLTTTYAEPGERMR
jgi:small-conductance mechanosensitive channel